MKEVFISYNSADEHIARSLYEGLDKNAISVWFAPIHIKVSDHYANTITKAIKSCNLFLLIASEASLGNTDKGILGSPEVIKEVQIASNNRKIIVLIKTDTALDQDYDDALQYHFSTSQWLDVSKLTKIEKQVIYLISEIKNLLADKKISSFIDKTSQNKQLEIFNNIEIALTEGHWKHAENLLIEHSFCKQYYNLIEVNKIYIKLQKVQYLKNLTINAANEIYITLKSLKENKSNSYIALSWYLIANLSKNFYDLNGIHNPTEGFRVSKARFKSFPIPRLSARTRMILAFVKDLEKL
jgi:hypothetical protein